MQEKSGKNETPGPKPEENGKTAEATKGQPVAYLSTWAASCLMTFQVASRRWQHKHPNHWPNPVYRIY